MSPLLATLPPHMLAALAAASRQKAYAEGDVLCHQSDNADTVWLVLDGWVKLTRETLDGGEAVWDVRGMGHMLGLETLTPPHRYTTRAVAVSGLTTLAISHAAMRRVLESHPPFALSLLHHTAAEHHNERLEMEHRTQQTTAQRIGCFLLKLVGTPVGGSATLNLPFDKSLLAARLGMQPETFSRALARLKADTGLQLDGPRMTVTDVDRMRAYTCGSCSGSYPCEPQ